MQNLDSQRDSFNRLQMICNRVHVHLQYSVNSLLILVRYSSMSPNYRQTSAQTIVMVSMLLDFLIYPSTLLYDSVKHLCIDAQSNKSVIQVLEIWNMCRCAMLLFSHQHFSHFSTRRLWAGQHYHGMDIASIKGVLHPICSI